MTEKVDASEFGLTPRTHLEREAGNRFVLVINRKSRLIMADGRRIAENADKIKSVQPGCKVSLKTKAPVCSKTKVFLSEIDIDII